MPKLHASPSSTRPAVTSPNTQIQHRPQQPFLYSKAFFTAVICSSFLSLSLNAYLAAKLGALHDLQKMEQDLVQTFTQDRPKLLPNNAAGSSSSDSGIPPKEGGGHLLAGLSCKKYGGPSPESAQEMVYWEDIPADNQYVSPFKPKLFPQYLSFEPDDGGWYVNGLLLALFFFFLEWL